MVSVNRIKIGSTAYDVSPSPTGTLDTTSTTKFISNDVDQASATSYTSVNKIDATETNSSIFDKITSIVRNVRYLHNKIGTTDISDVGDNITDAITTLNTKVPTHSHTTADLPVSSNQINSSSYIPTSALIYSMNQNLTSLNDSVTLGEDITINVDCGGLNSGTVLLSNSKLRSIIKNILHIPGTPSTEYESISIGTWSNAADVDAFFTTHTPQNGWAGLKLGNYVTINDGTYNTQWEIAGFNMEHNQTAADDSTYDNGYGICMIPKTTLPDLMRWNDTNTLTGGYKSSYIHNTLNTTIANNLKTILGDHLILRNVLLSSECNGTDSGKIEISSAYEWTTAYATLMSVGQLNGIFAQYNNKYDDGEANYKLPVFDHEDFKTGSNFWSRGIYGNTGNACNAWRAYSSGIGSLGIRVSIGVRPLIYLR